MIVLFVKDMPAQVTYSVATRLIAIIVSVCEIISSCVSIRNSDLVGSSAKICTIYLSILPMNIRGLFISQCDNLNVLSRA